MPGNHVAKVSFSVMMRRMVMTASKLDDVCHSLHQLPVGKANVMAVSSPNLLQMDMVGNGAGNVSAP